jgi:hypothetical protein
MKTKAMLLGLMLCSVLTGQVDSWNIVNRELPLEETFSSGTKVIVVVDYDGYSTLSYTNESDLPARALHYESVEGIPLSEDKIGPARFRTKELAPGETSQQTFNWANGQEVTIEVQQGQLKIVIQPEKKSI